MSLREFSSYFYREKLSVAIPFNWVRNTDHWRPYGSLPVLQSWIRSKVLEWRNTFTLFDYNNPGVHFFIGQQPTLFILFDCYNRSVQFLQRTSILFTLFDCNNQGVGYLGETNHFHLGILAKWSHIPGESPKYTTMRSSQLSVLKNLPWA